MAGNSHLDPQFGDASSLDKTIGSGFPCSFYSPSEPVDVGNWFSSYIYESPVIETGEESNCLISGENESEKVRSDSQVIVNKEEDFGDKEGSAFGSDCEPEKLAMDKGKSDLFVPEMGENESFYGNVVEEQGHNLVPITDEVDSPHNVDGKFSCSSDLSEPTDIINWFSSYVYESPTLDTRDKVNGVVFGESEVEKVGLVEVFSREKVENLEELKIHENERGYVFGGEDNKHRNYSAVKDKSVSSFTNTTENGSLADKLVYAHTLVSLKDDPTPILRNINSPQNLDSRISLGGDYILSKGKKSSSANNEKENSQDLRNSNGIVPKRPLSSINNKEGEIGSVTSNGFISTKKKYCTSKMGGHVSEGTRRNNQVLGEMQTALVRRPFSEKTNIFLNGVAAQEITGKWKCPQKSKPDLGPPMKQQRLECWIRRV